MIKLKGKHVAGAPTVQRKTLGSTSKDKGSPPEAMKSESSSPGVLTNTNLSNLPITIDLDPLLYGIAEDTLGASVRAMSRLYVDMYYYDPVAGSAVDLYSCLPFSEFTLGGVSDSKILDLYYENIERLNVRTLPNEISVDYLVLGTFLASLLYNREKKIFFDVMPHHVSNAEIQSLPFYSQDPIITVTFPEALRRVLSKDSPRILKIKERLGPQLVAKLLSGSVELDPLGSLYVPRKSFSTTEGTSYYKRILPLYLIEKNLYRGTLTESMRRQRGILHITLGDGDQWEPTLEDMEQTTDLFMCLAGDTLLHTEYGLRRIDSVCSREGMAKDESRDIDLRLKGADGKIVRAVKWWYRGYAPTVDVVSEYGHRITATPNHRVYALTSMGPAWVKVKDVSPTDYLCFDRTPIQVPGGEIGPGLAYVLGALHDAELRPDGIYAQVPDRDVFHKLYSVVRATRCNDVVHIEDAEVERLLRLPELELSTESQYAYIAGMLENPCTTRFRTSIARSQIPVQLALSNLGIMSQVKGTELHVHSCKALDRMSAHRISRYRPRDHATGLPLGWIVNRLQARRKYKTRPLYITDDFDLVQVPELDNLNKLRGAKLNRYDGDEERGDFWTLEDNQLDAVRQVSEELYAQAMRLLTANYVFLRVTKSKGAPTHVYDLTVAASDKPAFIANGMLVHNSADADPLGAVITTRQGIMTEEIRCLAGSSLIDTERGPVRIDQLVTHDPAKLAAGTRVPLKNVRAASLAGYGTVDAWWYQGRQETLRVEFGNAVIEATANHQFVTVDAYAALSMVKAGDADGAWLLSRQPPADARAHGLPVEVVTASLDGAQRAALLPHLPQDGVLEYAAYRQGRYKAALQALQAASPGLHRRTTRLLDAEYTFHKAAVRPGVAQHVYDLSMRDDAAPVFCVQGVLTKNSGGDFWKYTDIADQTTTYKLRALGISEGMLSGDQNYSCCVGSTFVPTTKGLLPLGMIGGGSGTLQDVDLFAASRFGAERAVKWLDNGEAPTLTVSTAAGLAVTCTPNHRFLVYSPRDASTAWVEASELRIGDYLCQATAPTSADRNHAVDVDGETWEVDPDLAYLTGCLLKKSYYAQNTVRISVGDERVARKIARIVKERFGHDLAFHGQNGRHAAQVTDADVIRKFQAVGCLNSLKNSQLPLTVLRTSGQAQLAFLASVLDNSCDSKIAVDSQPILRAVHALLTAQGIMTNYTGNAVYLMPGEGYRLFCLAAPHCVLDRFEFEVRRWFGVPLELRNFPAFLCYDKHEMGDYEEPLARLRSLEPRISNNLAQVLRLKYRLVRVSTIKDSGAQRVYDLSMEKEPAYVANGLVTHNTMEANMTVFVEGLRAYRDMMSRKIFYNKLFPLISVVHGLRTKGGKVVRGDMPVSTEDALEIMQDGSKLLIPTVHWNKQLKPEGDTGYLDILDRMTAAGVPVPLRVMAGAGGFNLDELLAQREEDMSLRKKFQEYMAEIKKLQPKGEEEEGDGGGNFEGLSGSILTSEDPSGTHRSAVHASNGRPAITDRKFDPEIVGRTRTGRKKWVYDQNAANVKANNQIVKAMRSLAKSQPPTETTPRKR